MFRIRSACGKFCDSEGNVEEEINLDWKKAILFECESDRSISELEVSMTYNGKEICKGYYGDLFTNKFIKNCIRMGMKPVKSFSFFDMSATHFPEIDGKVVMHMWYSGPIEAGGYTCTLWNFKTVKNDFNSRSKKCFRCKQCEYRKAANKKEYE